ncbi:MAG: homocysteine S-methyltransferase family protein [Sedimentisphaerales bacterium]|nr:homocysteine S-methyltransferase family protein [Sedimentisphaerales bacterium]
MARTNLKDRIRQGLFLLDGAMGSELIARGLEMGTCNEYLNVTSPNIVSGIHRAYLQAGSYAILTNTFGANKYVLARHGFGDEVAKINTDGAKIARQAAGKERYVLGDIGPSGDFLEPLGSLKAEGLKAAFAQQAKALLDGGVDGFIIETMTALDEMMVAIEAVKSIDGNLPVLASMAFDKADGGFKTMMGVDVEAAVSKMVSLEVDAVGFNCGTVSLDEYVELAEEFVSEIMALKKSRVTIFAEPNAGRPELVDGRAVYKVLPEDFAAAAEKIYSAGVKIIGGCCGTGPEHIEAIVKRLKRPK